ncbi:hypothetical protein O9A_01100 [Bartonella koehlerae C-29]|uniref:Uncharacterized protein n=1 Tax=Bartonella koehlerae C-29 TaxID=1134510 RepID=A0A067W6Q1_9HYPH|nr:hypothetical protein O9A_01100 [Bartonella koehlerae C-29]
MPIMNYLKWFFLYTQPTWVVHVNGFYCYPARNRRVASSRPKI